MATKPAALAKKVENDFVKQDRKQDAKLVKDVVTRDAPKGKMAKGKKR